VSASLGVVSSRLLGLLLVELLLLEVVLLLLLLVEMMLWRHPLPVHHVHSSILVQRRLLRHTQCTRWRRGESIEHLTSVRLIRL
jgi:hypothetical protein